MLHQKTMNDVAIEQVVKNGKSLTTLIWSTGYGDFEKLYNGTVKFRSFLVKDGFSKALREDLYSHYTAALGGSAKDVLDATKFNNGDWTFGVKETEGKESYALDKPGDYNITVNLDFSKGYKWNVEFDLKRGLETIDEQSNKDKTKRTRYAENAFFETPFDGEVKSKDGKRTGYGIALTGVQEGAPYISYNTTEKNTKFVAASEGIASKAFKYGNDFASTRPGTILTLTSTSFAYNPSIAAKVELGLGPRLQGTEGFLYELLEGSGEMAHNQADSILTWYKKDGTGFNDQKVSKTEGLAVCKEVATEHYGFKENNAQSTDYAGLAFVPIKDSYVLRVYCNQGTAELNAFERASIPAGYRAAGATSYQVTLNQAGQLSENSLKDFVEKIKDQKVCIDAKPGRMELLWNKSKLIEGFVVKAVAKTTAPKTPAKK